MPLAADAARGRGSREEWRGSQVGAQGPHVKPPWSHMQPASPQLDSPELRTKVENKAVMSPRNLKLRKYGVLNSVLLYIHKQWCASRKEEGSFILHNSWF